MSYLCGISHPNNHFIQHLNSSMPEMTEQAHHIICKDHSLTTDEISATVGISHGSCHKLFINNAKLYCEFSNIKNVTFCILTSISRMKYYKIYILLQT